MSMGCSDTWRWWAILSIPARLLASVGNYSAGNQLPQQTLVEF